MEEFPKANPERRIWYKLLRRGGDADHLTFERISYYHCVCSLHFVDGKPTTINPHPTLFSYNSFKQPSTPRAEIRRSPAVQGQLTTPKCSTTHQPRRLRVELPMGCTKLEAINCQPSIKLTKVDSHKGHLGSEMEIGPSKETGPSGSLSDQGIMLDLYLCISHFIGYTGLAQDCGIFSAMKKGYLLHCLVPSHQHINWIITWKLGLFALVIIFVAIIFTIIIDLMHFFLCSSATLIFKTRYNYWHMFMGKTLRGMLVMFCFVFQVCTTQPLASVTTHIQVLVWYPKYLFGPTRLHRLTWQWRTSLRWRRQTCLNRWWRHSSKKQSLHPMNLFHSSLVYLTKPLWQVLVLSF